MEKTHTDQKTPRVSANRLSDYMAASRQAGRGIIASCRYRARARVIQHNEARTIVAAYLKAGSKNPSALLERVEKMRARIFDTEFDTDLNEHNADYVERFAKVAEAVNLPDVELLPGGTLAPLVIEKVTITFTPSLKLRRTTKTNKVRTGALFVRYAKGKPLTPKVAHYQGALTHGYLRLMVEDAAEPDKALCLTLDAYAGKLYEAPSDAVYAFNEIKAECKTIAERWPNIEPPANAVF